LIEMLGHKDDLIRSRVAGALEAIGPSAFPELLEAYRTGSNRVSAGAATVLYSIDLQAAVKAGVR
jgi:HEAT repeat protein